MSSDEVNLMYYSILRVHYFVTAIFSIFCIKLVTQPVVFTGIRLIEEEKKPALFSQKMMNSVYSFCCEKIAYFKLGIKRLEIDATKYVLLECIDDSEQWGPHQTTAEEPQGYRLYTFSLLHYIGKFLKIVNLSVASTWEHL